MTAKITKRNVEEVTQVVGQRRSKELARVPAVNTHLNTATSTLAKVRKITYDSNPISITNNR